MGDAPGIAGSTEPEQAGCFVCVDESEANWFVRLNNTGGPVDVWSLEGVEEAELVESPEGHFFVPRAVPASALTLLRRDAAPTDRS